MKRRWTAALLALLLTAALLPTTAHAAQTDRSAGSHFTGADRAVYQALRAEVERIAAGDRASTSIRIPDLDELSWSLEELGLKGSSQKNVLDTLEAKFAEAVHIEQIFIGLAADCPYEMFWSSNAFSWGYTSVRQGDQVSIRDLTIQLQVAQAYRAGSSATTVSGDKVAAAHQAVENAKAIVEKYRDLSDYEKLDAYREEICRLTSYDMLTYRTDPPYGDPWQMIYVFDGDPDTEVVCEGYSKAFKYLCDLSDFQGDVTCWIVSGKMDRGDHMWNVVRMGDGKNYLVDLTNCDTGMIGENDKLFLSGAASSDGGRTYTVSKEWPCRAVYSYDDDQKGLFTDGWVTVSAEDYDDSTAVILPWSPEPEDEAVSFTDVAEGAYYADAVAWAVEQGITNGTSDATFSPDQDCTQAQILTFLWRAAGEPEAEGLLTIPGVANAYRSAIIWADSMGMIDQSEFDPNAPCTRSSAVSYIWRAFDRTAPEEEIGFTDVAEDAPYTEAVAWAVEQGITKGASDTTFDPDGTCTRGQIVTFLHRAYL